jgi:glycine reductase
MSQALRVVHYLNQFFGGIGGEEKASEKPQIKEGMIGMGRAIQDVLKGKGGIVATVICGDNYFAEKTEQAVEEVLKLITPYKPDILIAGPAFNAGRYGIACGELCKAAQGRMGIISVTGMYEENPGADLYRKDVYIVKTPESAKNTAEIATRMVNIVLRLASKERMGRPSEEGYFSRGIIVDERSDKIAAERAISMLLAKIKGEPFESEMETPKFVRIKPPEAIKNLAQAKIALVTDGGLIPKGNPENMESYRSWRFASYDIQGKDALSSKDFEAHHVGYDKTYVNEDPNRMVPLDVMRELEKEGVIGKLHDKIYSTAGVGTSLTNGRKIGRGIAEDLKAAGVNGVILTST